MKLIDLHCDTPGELFKSKGSLLCNQHHVDMRKTASFSSYCQMAALFCPAHLDDDSGFVCVREMACRFRQEVEGTENAVIATDLKSLAKGFEKGERVFCLTLEDARILGGDLSRIEALAALHLWFMTPLWRGESVIGGAHDTDTGLSEFGKEALARVLENGTVLDVSHASVRSFYDIAALSRAAERPIVATHSAARALCAHRRNLDNEQIRMIADMGGIIGINIYPVFLHDSGSADIQALIAHIRHIINVGGENVIALGTDFDGIASLPCGISSLADISLLATYMQRSGYPASLIDRLFYQNGLAFLKTHFR